MISFIKNYFTLSKILILIALFIITPIATQGINNVIALFISSNYIATVLNLIYIVFAYTRTSMLEDLSVNIIQRIGKKNYDKLNFKLVIISICIYCTLLYGTAIIFYAIPIGYEGMFLKFLIINTLVYIFEELVIILQIGSKKSIIYLIIPICINFVFRYMFVLPWANKIFS